MQRKGRRRSGAKAAAASSCLPWKRPSLQLHLTPLRLHPGEELREDRLFRRRELPPFRFTPNVTQSPNPPPPPQTRGPSPSSNPFLTDPLTISKTTLESPGKHQMEPSRWQRAGRNGDFPIVKKTPAAPAHHGRLIGTHLPPMP